MGYLERGRGGGREPADRPVNSLKIIMVTQKKSFWIEGARGGAIWPAEGKIHICCKNAFFAALFLLQTRCKV